jgi:hypothetical protein
MKFETPEKRCPTCGLILATNGYDLDEKGNNVLDENGSPVWREYAALVCETCCLNALAPEKRKPRMPRGYVDEAQLKIEAPMLEIR